MPKISAVGIEVTSNADGFELAGGSTNERRFGVSSGNVQISGGGGFTYTFPSASTAIVGTNTVQTLSNKTLAVGTELAASTTSGAPVRFIAGDDPLSPTSGMIWWNGTSLKFHTSATKTFAYTDSNITGTSANVTGIVALANGGTGSALSNPGANRLLFWDNTGSAMTWLTAGARLGISGTTLSAKQSVTIYVAQCVTPSTTGADADGEVTVPYSSADGTTSITYNIRRVYTRQATAGTTNSTFNVQRLTGTGAWGGSPSTLFTSNQTLSANTNENSYTPNTTQVSSGDKLRASFESIGSGAQRWSIWLLLEEA
jgi:hypothetical protein